jgi:hypothetical protein
MLFETFIDVKEVNDGVGLCVGATEASGELMHVDGRVAGVGEAYRGNPPC